MPTDWNDNCKVMTWMLNREYAIRTPPDCVSLEAQSHEKSKIYLTPSARQCYIQSSSPLSDVLFPLFFSKIFHFACHRTFFHFSLSFGLAAHQLHGWYAMEYPCIFSQWVTSVCWGPFNPAPYMSLPRGCHPRSWGTHCSQISVCRTICEFLNP